MNMSDQLVSYISHMEIVQAVFEQLKMLIEALKLTLNIVVYYKDYKLQLLINYFLIFNNIDDFFNK